MSKLDQLIAEYCPDGVEYHPFSDICTYVRGLTYNKSKEAQTSDSTNIKVLRANNITLGQNILNFDDVKEINPEVKVKEAQWLRKGDILICAGSGSKHHIGKVAYIDEDMNITYGGFMAVVRCTECISSRFLFHIMTGSMFRQYLEKALDTSTINNLNNEVMRNFMIPVPPLEVQREIVRVLDHFTLLSAELSAKLSAELKARKMQYEYYRNEILHLDGERIALQNLFETRNGFTPSKSNSEYWEGGTLPWFKIDDINDKGRVLSESYLHITEKALKKSGLFPANSIIISTSATIGEYALITVPFLCNQRFTCLTVKSEYVEKVNVKYLMHYCPILSKYCKNHLNKGNFASVDMKKFSKFEFVIPSLDEQQRIVNILDRFDALCNVISNGLPAEIEARQKQYKYYRDKLLTFKERKAE